MLTDEDIKKLIEVFATREEVTTKKDFDELREQFSELQTAVDSYAKKQTPTFKKWLCSPTRWTATNGGSNKLPTSSALNQNTTSATPDTSNNQKGEYVGNGRR